MIEQPNTPLGGALLGLSAVGGILWAVYEKVMRHRVERANNDVAVTMSEGQETLFSLMSQRLATLEAEVSALRQELERERTHRRAMEMYVFDLQDSMRANNIPVPAPKRDEIT